MKNTCVLSFDAVVLSDVVVVLLFTGTLPFIFSNTMRLGVTDHFLPWCLGVKCCFPKLFFFCGRLGGSAVIHSVVVAEEPCKVLQK